MFFVLEGAPGGGGSWLYIGESAAIESSVDDRESVSSWEVLSTSATSM